MEPRGADRNVTFTREQRLAAPRLDWSVLSTITAAAALSTLPLFLVGTLAVDMRAELNFSSVALGGLIAVASLVILLFAYPLACVIERIGYHPGLVIALLLVGLAMLGSGVFADRWWHLAAGQAVGASMAIPSVRLAMATRIPPERQGIAFGVNLAAIPAAILLAGIAVPLVGETAGWRWAFGGASALCLGASIAAAKFMGNGPSERIERRLHPIQRRLVFLGAVALFFGVWGAQTVATFGVEAGVSEGHSAGSMGYALGAAGVVSIVVRIAAGWRADHTGPVRAYGLVISIILLGAAGVGLLMVGGSFLVVATGVVLGLGFGYGWNGVLQLGVFRANPRAAARTASFIMIGYSGGAGVGSLVSGAIVSGPGFGAAWAVSIVAFAGAVAMVALARRDPHLSEIA